MNYIEKTISEELKFAGNIISVNQATVLLPNGKKATRDIVRHPGASVIVPITENNKLLLVRQYRKPCDMVSLELPAGKLDPGEEPEICAERELREETGFIAGRMQKVFMIHSTPGFCDEVLHMYVASELSQAEACPDEDEFISFGEYPVEDCVGMVMRGEITDAKTIIGIFLADKILRGENILS